MLASKQSETMKEKLQYISLAKDKSKLKNTIAPRKKVYRTLNNNTNNNDNFLSKGSFNNL